MDRSEIIEALVAGKQGKGGLEERLEELGFDQESMEVLKDLFVDYGKRLAEDGKVPDDPVTVASHGASMGVGFEYGCILTRYLIEKEWKEVL